MNSNNMSGGGNDIIIPSMGHSHTAPRTGPDALSCIFQDLRAKRPEVREAAAKALKLYVEAEARESSGETLTKFLSNLTNALSRLVNSNEICEKQGGIMAIDEIIDVDCEENATKITRFANFIRSTLTNCNHGETMMMTAKVLGHLARSGGTLTADLVQFEVKRALEWLEGDHRVEHRRLSAVYVLKELATNAPTLFNSYVGAFLSNMWVALRDSKPAIREGAVAALRASLCLLALRQSPRRGRWYKDIYNEADNGLNNKDADHVHGSLLAIGELLLNDGDSLCLEFMLSRFQRTSEILLQHLSYKKSREVRRTVIEIMPRLAFVYPSGFLRACLQKYIEVIIKTIKNIEDRAPCFTALGELAVAVTEASLPRQLRRFGAEHSSHDLTTPSVSWDTASPLPSSSSMYLPGLSTPASSMSLLATESNNNVLPLSPAPSTMQQQSVVGNQAVGPGPGLLEYLPDIVALIKENLTPRRGRPACPEALTCLSQLGKAIGPSLMPYLPELLDLMFSPAASLSTTLLDALTSLTQHLPVMLPAVQDRLLDKISVILAGVYYGKTGGHHDFDHVTLSTPMTPSLGASDGTITMMDSSNVSLRAPPIGHRVTLSTGGDLSSPSVLNNNTAGLSVLSASNNNITNANSSVKTIHFPLIGNISIKTGGLLSAKKSDDPTMTGGVDGYNNVDSNMDSTGNAAIVHALRTLGSFNWSGHILTDFVRHTVVTFLESNDCNIRLHAAIACCRILLSPNEQAPRRGYTAYLAGEVLEKLLVVGITDPDPAIRKGVLQNIDSRFDGLLAQPENLRSLFIVLNDEIFEIRETAMVTLGRLAIRNPAYVMPSLCKTLIQLVTELEYSVETRVKEESARLLGHLIREAQQLIRPYVGTIMNALLPKLKDPSSGVSSSVLGTLGELAQVWGDDILQYITQLLPIIIDTLDDQSSVSRRRVALRTLGQLVEATGFVVEPFFLHPKLLDILTSALKSEPSWPVRREVIKVLGVLGALDPYTYKRLQLKSTIAAKKEVQRKANVKKEEEDKFAEAAAIAADQGAVGGENDAAGGNNGSNEGDEPPPAVEELPKKVVSSGRLGTVFFGVGDGKGDDFEGVLVHPTNEDCYPVVAITALRRILRDLNLFANHNMVIRAVNFIFKTYGLKGKSLLVYIIPPVLSLIQSCERDLRDFLFQQLAHIVSIVKRHIRPYLPDMFAIIRKREYWKDWYLVNILTLLENISLAINEEFKQYLPSLMPLILELLSPAVSIAGTSALLSNNNSTSLPSHPSSTTHSEMHGFNLNNHGLNLAMSSMSLSHHAGRHITQKVLHALEVFGDNLNDFMYLVIPALVKLFEPSSLDLPVAVRILAMQSLASLCRNLYVNDYASRIIHPLVRVLGEGRRANIVKQNDPHKTKDDYYDNGIELQDCAMETLCALIKQLRRGFCIFIPTVNKVIRKQGISYQPYDELIAALHSSDYNNAGDDDDPFGSSVANSIFKIETKASSNLNNNNGNNNNGGLGNMSEFGDDNEARNVIESSVKKMKVNQAKLRDAWDTSQRSTKEDWTEWIRGFSVNLLRESPSPALRSCFPLAQVYEPLARELFNIAFVSCWNELFDDMQDHLVENISRALESKTIPSEILTTLLNLAEFMEHDDKPLPIDIRKLGELAEKCHAYAKALHYKEMEFHRAPTSATVEALISINNKLQQPEAALGVLTYAEQHLGVKVQEGWYEKLQRWEEALLSYERRHEEEIAMLSRQLQHDAVTGGYAAARHSASTSRQATFAVGRMRCLKSLAEWEQLAFLANEAWEMKGAVNMSFSSRNSRRTTASVVNGATATPFVGSDDDGGAGFIQEVASLAAAAAWNLGQWDKLAVYVEAIGQETLDGSFYRAILALHNDDFDLCHRLIDSTRAILNTELAALVSESYNRAYRVVVTVQQLAELEEMITYKRVPEQRGLIEKMWTKRLKGCQRDVEVWQRLVAARSIVLPPQQDVETWLKFATLCRKSDRLKLSRKTIMGLLGSSDDQRGSGIVGSSRTLSSDLSINHPDLSRAQPRVAYAYVTHLWACGGDSMTESYHLLSDLIKRVSNELNINHSNEGGSNTNYGLLHRLLSRCFLKQGEWLVAIQPQQPVVDEVVIKDALKAFHNATQHDPGFYQAWHAWAFMNYQAVLLKEKEVTSSSLQSSLTSIPETATVENIVNSTEFTTLLVCAVSGFFRSIELGVNRSLQDILRLLTVWFSHGEKGDVPAALEDGFNRVPIDTWLKVIPQIIARIHIGNPIIRRQIRDLLCRIGKAHPQAIVYSLTVASKSLLEERRAATQEIIGSMRVHSSSLVDQAQMVSQELIRVAILWNEMWAEALEEASRQYFADHDVEAMLATVAPLHQMMEKGPETQREVAFQQSFGRDLHEANEWCRKYKESGREQDLNQAWDLYYHVFRRINKQLPGLTSLELRNVSPLLLNARNLELVVPGTYRSIPGGGGGGQPTSSIGGLGGVMAFGDESPHNTDEVIRIAVFAPTLSVITSKQRPRKLTIYGSDGGAYAFLLKGHEDLRQDERVMQLLGLVNSLLAADRVTCKKDLEIPRYAVIPLAPNSGLIGWVPHCDTLHALIREYRDARRIVLSIESRLMVQFAPDYDNLSLMQKVEVFKYALDNTTGMDLYKVLWLKSASSEVWLDRRTNFTRSLAVMSAVGYILGLGDRHPCNLMLDRVSGKVLHIDFGDCFEVAMHREKFPERVPFRLTRMMISAMEVSGIEGNFRSTCNEVMTVLRDNKESVMAMLEAFVYDPLINWRLLSAKSKEATAAANAANGGPVAATSTAIDKNVKENTERAPRSRELLIMNVDGYAQPEPSSSVKAAAAIAGGAGVKLAGSVRDLSSRQPHIYQKGDDPVGAPVVLNQRALAVIRRVSNKLTGRDFEDDEVLNVHTQVQRLIEQATSHENLCQSYTGWCAFW